MSPQEAVNVLYSSFQKSRPQEGLTNEENTQVISMCQQAKSVLDSVLTPKDPTEKGEKSK